MKTHEHIHELAWLRPVAVWGGVVFLCVCLIPCTRAVWKDGRIGSGFMPGLMGIFLWAAIWGLAVPITIANSFKTPFPRQQFAGVPDLMSVLTMGWLPALLFSCAVWLVRKVIVFIRAQRIKNQESKI